SANAFTADEFTSFVAVEPGDYYILVSSPIGSYSPDPYTLTVGVETFDETCVKDHLVDMSNAPGPYQGGPDGGDALILWNYSRMADTYDASLAGQLQSDLQSLADMVNGTLVSVEYNDLEIQEAYNDWDQNCWDGQMANAVAEAIKTNIIDIYSNQPYLVLVGSDDMLPFYRVPDETSIGNEKDYLYLSLTDSKSPTYWSLEKGYVLTDNFYGDEDPMPWRGRELYVPDRATGRLVETPDDIRQTILNYTSGPNSPMQNCMVSGYQFLTDSAIAIDNRVGPGGFGLTSETQINDTWIRDDLLDSWQRRSDGIPLDLVSVNAHFEHWRAEPANGAGGLIFSSDITNSANQVAYSMGCHGGLNVPNTSVSHPDGWLDFPESFAKNGAAAWVANTGFGYGVDDAIAASEQLMLFYTQELGFDNGQNGVAVGQALVNAKQRYTGNATFGGFSVFDEKAMIEATLYGLPMYTVTVPSPQDIGGSDVIVNKIAENPGTPEQPLGRITYSIITTPEQKDTEYGTYFHIGDEVQAWPGRPIQPRAAFALDEMMVQSPRGQILLNATYRDIPSFDPVVVIPVTQDSLHEPSFNAPGWYPSKLWSINRFGDQNRSTLVFGQFDPDLDIERLYDNLVLETFYSADTSDYDPPLIWGLASDPYSNPVEIGFAATVDDAVQVWVTVSFPNGDGGRLESFPLSLITPANLAEGQEPDLWEGRVPLDPAEPIPTEYYIQAIDEAGNVATASKEGFHVIGGGEPDAYQSVSTEREVEIVLEFNYGDGNGYQPLIGKTATEVILTGVGSIVNDGSDTCSPGTAGTDTNGICTIKITSDQPGDSFLTVKYRKEVPDPENPEQTIIVTNASFTFITRWWAGSASIHKSFEEGPFSKNKPLVCFSVRPEGSANGNEICSDGSSEFLFSWENLPGGSYIMEETSTGSDFVLMDPIHFMIDAGHQDFRAPTSENKLKPVGLQIFKQHYGGSAWTGPQVTFEIYGCGDDLNCNDQNALTAKVTVPDPVDGSNPVSTSLPEGKYLVVEIPPTGYKPIEGDQVISLVAGSTGSLTYTNASQGCSPGFWQGGNGSQLWNEVDDQDWVTSGGSNSNPYTHDDSFNGFFQWYASLDGKSMMDLVITGGGSEDWQKAARNVVAAYLNASWGMGFPYSQQEIKDMWSAAIASDDFIGLHNLLSSANSPPSGFCPIQ
ncbi:MAG: hypothetical protein PVF74_05545, partial [Anaerolineales bacterium]